MGRRGTYGSRLHATLAGRLTYVQQAVTVLGAALNLKQHPDLDVVRCRGGDGRCQLSHDQSMAEE